jgi:outer membrane protein OmpA-like peptidoglycan-associated protein
MTLKQAVLATLLAGGATVAIMTGRGSPPEKDHAAAPDATAVMTAQAPGAGSTPAPTTPLAAPATDTAQAADDEARLAGAIAAAVAEAEAERLRLATELAAAEEEKTRLAAALAEAEAEAALLTEALEIARAAQPAAPGETGAVAPDAGPEIAALEALIEDQAAQIARLTAALAERDATLAALEDERKILGDLFDLAPMTAALAGPALGAATPVPAPSGEAAAGGEADLDAAIDAAKAPPPRARPGTVMEGRPVAEVHFDHGMSRLSPGGAARAREAAQLIAALGVTRVRLSGHADTTGRASANMRLSQNRAEAVRAVLVAQGIRPEIIEIEAHGQDAEALPVATPAGVAEPLNRRVGIYVETAVRTAFLQ